MSVFTATWWKFLRQSVASLENDWRGTVIPRFPSSFLLSFHPGSPFFSQVSPTLLLFNRGPGYNPGKSLWKYKCSYVHFNKFPDVSLLLYLK